MKVIYFLYSLLLLCLVSGSSSKRASVCHVVGSANKLETNSKKSLLFFENIQNSYNVKVEKGSKGSAGEKGAKGTAEKVNMTAITELKKELELCEDFSN